MAKAKKLPSGSWRCLVYSHSIPVIGKDGKPVIDLKTRKHPFTGTPWVIRRLPWTLSQTDISQNYATRNATRQKKNLDFSRFLERRQPDLNGWLPQKLRRMEGLRIPIEFAQTPAQILMPGTNFCTRHFSYPPRLAFHCICANYAISYSWYSFSMYALSWFFQIRQFQ